MGFFSSAVKAVGGAVGGALGNKLFGPSEGSKKRADRRAGRSIIKQMKLGNKFDMQNQRRMFDFKINRMLGHGLTPWEAFGSPGATGGSGTTGSGTTLGNSATEMEQQNQQLEQDRQLQMQQMGVQAATELEKTRMQTDAQKYTADTAAGTQTRGQDINAAIAERTFNLDKAKLANEVRKTAASIGKTEQETKKLVNETITSSPKFVTAMKQLSMGPANLLVELTLRHHGIALNDESFTNLPEAKRQEILNEILALSSTSYVEGAGASTLGGAAVEGAKNTVRSIFEILQDVNRGVRNTVGDVFQGRQNDIPSLGARFSEPYQSAPNMSFR